MIYLEYERTKTLGFTAINLVIDEFLSTVDAQKEEDYKLYNSIKFNASCWMTDYKFITSKYSNLESSNSLSNIK